MCARGHEPGHLPLSVSAPQDALRTRLRELATARLRWGYRRLYVLLRREGHLVNRKRVYRLYREEGLAVRRRRRKRVAQVRVPLAAPQRCNEGWGVDFMHDALLSGALPVLQRRGRLQSRRAGQ